MIHPSAQKEGASGEEAADGAPSSEDLEWRRGGQIHEGGILQQVLPQRRARVFVVQGPYRSPPQTYPILRSCAVSKILHSLSTFAYRSEFFEKITSSITEEVDRGGYRARSLRLAFSLSPSFPLSISLSLTTNIAVYVLLVSDCAVKTPKSVRRLEVIWHWGKWSLSCELERKPQNFAVFLFNWSCVSLLSVSGVSLLSVSDNSCIRL